MKSLLSMPAIRALDKTPVPSLIDGVRFKRPYLGSRDLIDPAAISSDRGCLFEGIVEDSQLVVTDEPLSVERGMKAQQFVLLRANPPPVRVRCPPAVFSLMLQG